MSKGLKITFHRAFDSIVDSKKAIDLLSKIGVNRILSSGKANKAVNGIKNLIDWKNYDSKILIQPGGGIDKSSALLFKNEGFESIHLSGTLEEKWNRPIPKSTDNTFIKQTVRRPSFKKMEDIIEIAKN